MGKRWRIFPHDAERVAQLEKIAGVPPLVAQLLVCRGMCDRDQVQTFLAPKLSALRDPDELPGLPDAADRLIDAVKNRREIVIYGDYDADGMTATAILLRCLRLLGGDVGYHMPNRLDDGYGLNHQALHTLAERGTKTVVSVDCGIASVEHAETAKQLGLELIITDHHEPGERLPDAAAIVHPRLPGSSYPFGGLCGAGVALKLAWGVCQRSSQSKRVSPPMREFLLTAVGLAALGTIADVVPLLDENRVLVKYGLTSLRAHPIPGLDALMKITQLDQKSQLKSEDVAFTLAPRLNAAGRLGQAQLGVELLVTDSPERATALAQYIHALNGDRDSLDRRVQLQAGKQIKDSCDVENDPAFVLAGRGWHPGVIGLVAGRIAEKYNRPTVMISIDDLGVKPATGSARSACGLNLHQALAACSEHLVAHGGHAAAAGLKILESKIDAFRADFYEYASAEISEQDRLPELSLDVEAPLSQLTLNIVQQIEQLAPFGRDNPRPLFYAGEVRLAEPPRRMGGGDRHLSVRLTQHRVSLRGVAFGRGEWADELEKIDAPIDIAFRPVINDFRGRVRVELHLEDWRPARTATSPVSES